MTKVSKTAKAATVKAKASPPKAKALKANAGDARKVAAAATVKAKAKASPPTKGKAKAKAEAPKAEAPKADYVQKPGCGVVFASDAMVTLVHPGNPKREGCKAWHRYQAMLHAYAKRGGKMTVADTLAVGFRPDDLRWGTEKGHLNIAGAKVADGFDRQVAFSQPKATPTVAKAALVAAKAEAKVKFDRKLAPLPVAKGDK